MILYLIFLLTMLLFVCSLQRITIFHITLHVSYLKRSFVTCRFIEQQQKTTKSFRINKRNETETLIQQLRRMIQRHSVDRSSKKKLGVNNKWNQQIKLHDLWFMMYQHIQGLEKYIHCYIILWFNQYGISVNFLVLNVEFISLFNDSQMLSLSLIISHYYIVNRFHTSDIFEWFKLLCDKVEEFKFKIAVAGWIRLISTEIFPSFSFSFN